MNQKILISLLIAFLFSTGSHLLMAQSQSTPNQPRYDRKKIHFGFYLGGNVMHFSLKMKPGFSNHTYYQLEIPSLDVLSDSAFLYNVESLPHPGFTIGIVSSLRLGKYFDLRFTPELLFNERSLKYDILTYFRGEAVFIEGYKTRIPSTHLNFPLYIKYKGVRLHNVRPYVFVGLKVVLDLAAQAGKKEKEGNNKNIIKLYRTDFAFEAGVGFDFYFNWFKMGTELRMSYGMHDILHKEDNIYTNGIESLRSRIFQLVFTFE